MSFKEGDRVVVKAASMLVGTIIGWRNRPWNRTVWVVDIEPRGGPCECEDWELTPATALDEIVDQLTWGGDDG